MIRGVKQPFKFTTSKNFADIDHIEVIFSQHNNSGSTDAPLPIMKYYDGKATKVTSWSEDDKEQDQTYYVDTTYYRYDSKQQSFVSSEQCPVEDDISGGAIAIYPVDKNSNIHESLMYKCDASYYQYDPDTTSWIITDSKPSEEYTIISAAGVDNIPSTADKKRVCVYNGHYYRYNGVDWESSESDMLPIITVPYWDLSKINNINENGAFYYERDKAYCAEETYYKCIDGIWTTYGRPEEVTSLNSTNCDISKIYMMKEWRYQHNIETNQFEQIEYHEVYYKYDTDNEKWIECDYPFAGAEEIDLWVEADADTNKIYVCKHVYYRYNAGLDDPTWEATRSVLIPVIQIERWLDDAYHDTSKVYMCQTKYYQYSIENGKWEEVETPRQHHTVTLDYWTDNSDRDKNNIYFCGTTYFQYDSSVQKWISSGSFKLPLVQIDQLSEMQDQSKIYECSPTYYAYKDGKWIAYKNMVEAVRNDGIVMVNGDPRSFVVELTSEETLRFNARHKGCVQAIVDDMSHPIQYFSIYPSLTSGDNSYD